MRTIVIGLLSLSLHVYANETLYEDLKTPSQTEVSTNVLSIDTIASNKISQYRFLEKHVPVFDENASKDYLPQSIIINETFPYRYRELVEDSIYLQLLMLSSIGVLALMPESVTNWNSEDLREKSLWVRWKDNVFEGPVWDNDDWTINYIGHPVSGAYYYTMARNDGMSVGESAAFSTLMSTFFWEYGYEAFAEVPSIQDLIITPLAGSLLGEGMIILQKKIDRNGGMVWDSKTLGNISYFLIDPLGSIADGVKNLLKSANMDVEVTMRVMTYPRASGMSVFPFATTPEYSMLYGEREYAFVITFQ